jgi:hypothetical protein
MIALDAQGDKNGMKGRWPFDSAQGDKNGIMSG